MVEAEQIIRLGKLVAPFTQQFFDVRWYFGTALPYTFV